MITSLFKFFAADPTPCPLPQDVFGVPTWYKYLEGYKDPITGACSPLYRQNFDITKLDSLAGIGLAVIEILLRLVAVTAVIWLVYGGFQYLISQGEPDRTKSAKDTILNAIIGLIIAVSASVIVVFIGRTLT